MYFVGCSSLVAYRISPLPIIYIYYKSHWTGNQIITRLMVKPCQRPPFSCAHPKIMFWHGLNLPQKSSSEPVHMCHSHISCKKKHFSPWNPHISWWKFSPSIRRVAAGRRPTRSPLGAAVLLGHRTSPARTSWKIWSTNWRFLKWGYPKIDIFYLMENPSNKWMISKLVCGWETFGSSLAHHLIISNREYEYP